jgi:hypothetical protein
MKLVHNKGNNHKVKRQPTECEQKFTNHKRICPEFDSIARKKIT